MNPVCGVCLATGRFLRSSVLIKLTLILLLSFPYGHNFLALVLNCYMAMMRFSPHSRPGRACHAGALMYYNTMVALPMSLSLMKDRLEQGYYRQVQGVMGDVATIQGNAQAFNGEDSQVAEMAAGRPPVMLCPCPHVHSEKSRLPLTWFMTGQANSPFASIYICAVSQDLRHAHQSALSL